MKYTNAGNVLPFFEATDWQRHRQTGQDALPYGLPASRTRLIPFQAYFSDIFTPTSWIFKLVNVEGGTIITLDSALLEFSQNSDGTFWLTFKGDYIHEVPDCGFWYVWLSATDGTDTLTRYSEVLRLANWPNFENASMDITDCSVDGSNAEFFLSDTSSLIGTADSVLVEKRVGSSWVGIGTGDCLLTVAAADEAAIVRITVESSTGNTLQTQYSLTWDSADPCSTVDMGTPTTSDTLAADLPDLWRIVFDNVKDRGLVVYQTGYEQELFIEPAPIFDVPEIVRELETVVNGQGKAITRTARTVERQRFETMDLPDYVIHFLSGAAELDSITLENVTTGKTLTLENMAFTSRRQGKELNTGQFAYDGRSEYFAGCDEDFTLVS